MAPVTLGFQSSSGTASVIFFDLDIPSNGRKHHIGNLLTHATNGGNPVTIPQDFLVSEILLSKPSQLSKDGSVEIDCPSGSSDHRATATLSASKNDVKVTAVAKEIVVTVK